MAATTVTTAGKKKPFHLGKWIKSRKGQQTLICIAFAVIPLLLLFVFTYLPFGKMIQFSFLKMKYTTPVEKRQFVGWQNYLDVFRRDDCFGALKLSLYYIVGALIQLVIALFLATILSFKVKGGNLFKGFMFFPYLISGIAIGFIFKFFYTRGFVLDTILQWCGFGADSLPYWLKDQSINNWSLVFTSIWRYMGQMMVLFIGAIMSVDAELYEAADLDGANKFQQFRHIILPSIKTIVTLNIILAITGSLSAFEQPYVITSGANGTGTYFVIMDRLAHTSQKIGLACAMAVVLLVIILVCAGLQQLFFKYVFRDADSDDESYKAKRARLKMEKAQAKAMKGGR
ncbi:MAG: sugar ABC transporter permease [Muribaculaceae bacterium]|nr:sugar ABC transporter permease [Roseburia sp.]MCM1430155.1 sugar ABC transporter permease [Muribaculaceae bacterium]MCM1493086.1 sugar ABC transporter permease [Muribaculaceae bacterium]